MFIFKVHFIIGIFSAVFFSTFFCTNAIKRTTIIYDDIPTTFNNYKSVIEPPDDTLTPIYEFAKDFIDATVPVNFDIAGVGEETEWQEFFAQYTGVLTYVILMLAIGLILPIVGIIFAISRCFCNCCGAKATEKHPKRGKMSVVIAGGFFAVFSAFLFFAVVVGMRSNVVIEKGAEKVFDKVSVTMRDIIKYSDNTYSQIQHLMELNYRQFSDGLTADLNAINEQLSNQIDAEDLPQIKEGFDLLEKSIQSLEKTNEALTTIKNNQSDINGLKNATENLATSCESHEIAEVGEICREIKVDVAGWDIPQFAFPDLSPILLAMKKIEFGELDVMIDLLIGFGAELNDSLKLVAEEAKKNTDIAGTQISTNLANAKQQTDQVKQFITSRIDDIEDARAYYTDWAALRYSLTFLPPALLLFILLLAALGLLTGTFCRSPYYKEKGCGNSSIAADFLLTGVSLIFLFALALAVVVCGYFAVGMIGQRFVCNTFDTMDNVKGLEYLDDSLDVQQYFGEGVTFGHLLRTCNANKALYEVMILKNIFDLDEIINYLDEYNIKEELTKLTETINNRIIEFQDNFSTESITKLKNIPLDNIQLSLYDDQLLQMQILLTNLKQLLKLTNANINGLDVLILTYLSFIANFDKLAINFKDFQKKIKMGGNLTYDKRLDEFKMFLDDYYLSITNGNFKEWGKNLTDTSIETVQTYLERIRDEMLGTVGLCEPASVAVKAMLNEVCGNVVNPMNAFWLANLFALIAFIPLLGIFIFYVSYFRQYVMTDDDRYRQQNYYIYNPPGGRGSTVEAYDVRDHHRTPTQPHSTPTHPHNPPTLPNTTPAPPNQYYNPNSGNVARTAHAPTYPSAGDAGGTPMQGHNLRRQHEYPYAMKGTTLGQSDVHENEKDKYTRF